MKRSTPLLSFMFLLVTTIALAQDGEGCKEHPMFPNRMPNYFLTTCSNNFDAVDFWISPDASKTVTKEGSKTALRYDFNTESGQQKPSALQILRNYENAAKKIGGVTMYFNVASATAVFRIVKGGKDIAWVKVESGGNDSNDFYELSIVELEAMKQEITSTDILTALNTDGHIALYINFATGKSDILPESAPVVEQVAQMLQANPSLKVSVEGHTDNVGSPASNKILSENRAGAVMNACIAKGIEKSRMTSKGWGPDKAIADNSSEEGRARNRRVEIVKQ